MKREELEEHLTQGWEKGKELWGTEREDVIRDTFDSAFAGEAGAKTEQVAKITITRTSGRSDSQRWYSSEQNEEVPLIVAAIECEANETTIKRIVTSDSYDAAQTCPDGETTCEVLRRRGHPNEARVLTLIADADPQGARNARPRTTTKGSPWPKERMALWKAYGAALNVMECLSRSDANESAAQRWNAVADAVGGGRADEMVAIIGEWEPTNGQWPENETGALRELGEAQGATCDAAPTKAVETLVAKLAQAGNETGDQREEIAKRWKRWQRAGGAPGTAGLRATSAQVQKALESEPRWRMGWTQAAERSLVYTASSGHNVIAGFEASLDHEIPMDGMLRHPTERDGNGERGWRPVLNIAVMAGAQADLVQRLIDAGARPASCDLEGRNVWHVLMAHKEQAGEADVVEVLAKADSDAMRCLDVNGRRPEDLSGHSWKSRWTEQRVTRFRDAGASMNALTVIKTTNTGDEHLKLVALWHLAVKAPGGARELFQAGPKAWQRGFRYALETSEETRNLAKAIVSSARRIEYEPAEMAKKLCAVEHARALGGPKMIGALVKAWPELAETLDATPQLRMSVAQAALATQCGRDDEEKTWLETLFTARLGREVETDALVQCAAQCARLDWSHATRVVSEMIIARSGPSDKLIDEIIDAERHDGKMMRAVLDIDAIGTWVRNEAGRHKRRSVARALKRWNVPSADALREAGAVLDKTTVAGIIEMAAQGGLHGDALTWSKKWLSETLRKTPIPSGVMARLVLAGRRDVLEWMAREGHAKRVIRAASQAARKSEAGLGEHVLGIMAELGAGEELSDEHRVTGARQRKGWRRVVVLGGRLGRACGLGPQWAYEGMVSGKMRLIEGLGGRRIGAHGDASQIEIIDVASAIARAQGYDPQALAQALEAQGWTPRCARQIGAVIECPGRAPQDTLAIASGLMALGKRRTRK